MTIIKSRVTGVGSQLPSRVITNHDLATFVDTSDAWIRERTGIVQRYFAGEGETAASLGTLAAQKALNAAERVPTDIDLIVVATTTPDKTFPSVASMIQHALAMPVAVCFDVQAVCSGFVYALSVADAMLRAGNHRRALVIGTEVMSKLMDWQDRTTSVLFGDGAGAVVLEALEEETFGIDKRALHDIRLYTDGRYENLLCVDGGVGTTQSTGYLRMKGQEVFKHAVAKMGKAVRDCMARNCMTIEDVDWVVPHQANQRILDALGKQLGIPQEKMISTLAQHANTSAASIPLALDAAIQDGRIQKGDLLMLEAMGGGFTWASGLLRL